MPIFIKGGKHISTAKEMLPEEEVLHQDLSEEASDAPELQTVPENTHRNHPGR